MGEKGIIFLVTALWWKMGDQRQVDAIPGTPAALGIPLQHWILPVWRGILKTSYSMLSTLNSRSDRAFQPPLPASWVTRAVWIPVQSTSFFYPVPVELCVSWAGFTARNTHLPVLSDLPWHRGKANWFSLLILLLTTPVQNWTLTFPLPLLFCLPLTDWQVKAAHVAPCASWLCDSALLLWQLSPIPWCLGFFEGVFKAFSLTFFSKDHGCWRSSALYWSTENPCVSAVDGSSGAGNRSFLCL